jgi:glc operon protein GlcG
MAAAERKATEQSWPMVIAIMDSTGHLVLFEKMDQAQLGSVDVAVAKAETAVKFRRPTKTFEDAIAAGGIGVRLATMRQIIALEGGIPLIENGQVIGSIGVSGMLSSQDAEVARAGAAVLADAPSK